MNQFKHAKWWRSYLDKLWQSFWKLKFMKNQALELYSPLPKSFKVCKEGTMEKRKTEDSSCSLLSHFWSTSRSPFSTFYIPFQSSRSQESNAQTVYDLELKWGRYGFRKTTAPGLCENFAQHLPNSHTPLHGANFPLFLPIPHEIFSFGYFCINFHSSLCNPPIIRFIS